MERPKMNRADRAKIFMPFNPLEGFAEALRAKEAEIEAQAAAGNLSTNTARSQKAKHGPACPDELS